MRWIAVQIWVLQLNVKWLLRRKDGFIIKPSLSLSCPPFFVHELYIQPKNSLAHGRGRITMARAANNISINFLIALACTNQNEFIKNQSRKRSKQGGLETSISKGIEVIVRCKSTKWHLVCYESNKKIFFCRWWWNKIIIFLSNLQFSIHNSQDCQWICIRKQLDMRPGKEMADIEGCRDKFFRFQKTHVSLKPSWT